MAGKRLVAYRPASRMQRSLPSDVDSKHGLRAADSSPAGAVLAISRVRLG